VEGGGIEGLDFGVDQAGVHGVAPWWVDWFAAME
jgi:hypothetical protein